MSDLRPQYNEEAVGANHPTKADVINRAYNVEHDVDGTHKAAVYSLTKALNTAYATVASHATTSAIWAAAANIINFTGAETVTDFPAAPQVGAQRFLICAGTAVFTHAGSITVQGGATHTAAAGDVVIVTATTTTAFKITVFKQDGKSIFNPVAAAITHEDTSHAPSGDVVFDALAGKLANIVEDATPQLGADLDQQGFKAGWSVVPTANFTATPASTSTITMTVADMTAKIKAGMALEYTIGGTAYYGRVKSHVYNGTKLLTVEGAPLGGDITLLRYNNNPGCLTFVHIGISGTYEDATNSALILTDRKEQAPLWNKPTSYCVYFSEWSNTHDSTTHGTAGPLVNGQPVCSTAAGLTVAADATKYETTVNIDTANYDINFGEPIEIGATKNGAGDASDLTTEMVFVTP